eukprot:TRINITY_DN8876_c0_g2_i4.p3 TRINITY_DN8876_c0_g2~~TRINITY_DN8876_c0_g2_i4.p3  ORF type:complete len:119 (-),score=4.98 TRINITY_DN8876_c0_g2_i4:185-541(-)
MQRSRELCNGKPQGILNICFCYTATQEISGALESVHEDLQSGKLQLDDINSELFESRLYTKEQPPVDILVRTSGETRLSDFLLWQCRNAMLSFVQQLWPEFSFNQLVKIIMQYQQQQQ